MKKLLVISCEGEDQEKIIDGLRDLMVMKKITHPIGIDRGGERPDPEPDPIETMMPDDSLLGIRGGSSISCSPLSYWADHENRIKALEGTEILGRDAIVYLMKEDVMPHIREQEGRIGGLSDMLNSLLTAANGKDLEALRIKLDGLERTFNSLGPISLNQVKECAKFEVEQYMKSYPQGLHTFVDDMRKFGKDLQGDCTKAIAELQGRIEALEGPQPPVGIGRPSTVGSAQESARLDKRINDIWNEINSMKVQIVKTQEEVKRIKDPKMDDPIPGPRYKDLESILEEIKKVGKLRAEDHDRFVQGIQKLQDRINLHVDAWDQTILKVEDMYNTLMKTPPEALDPETIAQRIKGMEQDLTKLHNELFPNNPSMPKGAIQDLHSIVRTNHKNLDKKIMENRKEINGHSHTEFEEIRKEANSETGILPPKG